MILKQISYATIERIWHHNLWPGRVSAIEPYSAMTFMGDYSGLSFKDRPAAFIGGFVEGEPEQLVAVNSVHLAERFMARSRGLWVDPTYRGRGYGTTILNATNTLARVMGAEAIWTFPRKTSIHSYEEAGFKRMSSWLDHGEFGPNCYAICFLGK